MISKYIILGVSYLTLKLGGSCIEPRDKKFQLDENQAVSFYLVGDEVIRYRDHVDKSKAGFPLIRYVNLFKLLKKNLFKTSTNY